MVAKVDALLEHILPTSHRKYGQVVHDEDVLANAQDGVEVASDGNVLIFRQPVKQRIEVGLALLVDAANYKLDECRVIFRSIAFKNVGSFVAEALQSVVETRHGIDLTKEDTLRSYEYILNFYSLRKLLGSRLAETCDTEA